MSIENKIFQMNLGGRELKVEIGRYAPLAKGAAMMRYEDTVVLVTAAGSSKPRAGLDFFPLSCEYQEKMYAVGKIPGGYIKREGRPSENATLTSRLIDRPIRPLFPDGYKNEVQIVATVLSVDQNNSPEITAMIGSSIALSISDLPFNGPTGAVKVGLVDGEYVINPTVEQAEKSLLDLTVAGTKDAIMMVEAGSKIISEEEMLNAILFGHEAIKEIVSFIENIVNELGVEKKEYIKPEENLELKDLIKETVYEELLKIVRINDKVERGEAEENLIEKMTIALEEKFENADELKNAAKGFFKSFEKEQMRLMITNEGIRTDGRKPDEIRAISTEVGIIPRTHGSGYFMRGLTAALSLTTLGALGEAQRLDGIDNEETRRYMHHYNFPPFSVGEAGPMRGPNRRAIGHGALGERALVPVLPSQEDFPYAIRVVSEVLSCNGSSSQASICGSSLSLLDAGVPIKDSVAGIAMGLIKEDENIAILSDIQGMEDFLGDMDFKVAGTKEGITAIQMDIKIQGIGREILEKALEQARVGRLFILDKMSESISTPRSDLSEYAPRVFNIKVHPDKIRDIIGPGGKVITKITSECDVKIDIDENGMVLITANDGKGGKEALKRIETIVKDIEVGEIYTAKIVKIAKFGVFVELLPGKDALCHISQLTIKRLNKVEDLFKVGDEIVVKVIEKDAQGKTSVSRKVLLNEEEEKKSN
ncbi:MAG: polyribonucleotide nucleotidyltransferase [Clostridiales bacterium]|nr:polyribonucleotide nucleotidyltransferase [Clostridiales bacterium]